jgi:hypothetical protein
MKTSEKICFIYIRLMFGICWRRMGQYDTANVQIETDSEMLSSNFVNIHD